MGYNPTPEEQWTRDDLDRAAAAGDHAAISAARKSGHLTELLEDPHGKSTAEPAAVVSTEPVLPVGPTVPSQSPGGEYTYNSGAQMSQHELDALSAAGAHDQIVAARKAGRLRNLGA